MLAVKTRVNADSLFVATTSVQYPLVNDYGEKIEHLPRGTALHAARSPVTKEVVRVAPFSKQSTGHRAAPEVAKPRSNSTSSNLNNSHDDVSSPSENPATEASATIEPSRTASNGADLARRAAHRVNVWKKSEQERRGEEERARQVKHEQEKHRQNHAAHAKQRRRAEIYALNELLRQLQQEKIARYIAVQKQLQEEVDSQQGTSITSTTAALAQVRAIGV